MYGKLFGASPNTKLSNSAKIFFLGFLGFIRCKRGKLRRTAAKNMQKKKCTANAPIHRVLNPKDNWALQTPNAKVVVPLAGCVMGIAMFVKSLGKESFGVGEETNELMVQSMIGFLGGSH